MKNTINPYVYFIERKDNHLWVAEKGIDETSNPLEAKLFNTIQEADKYIAENNLSKWYYSTEHLFTETLTN